MANNRTFFGNKLTGEFCMIDKHYNDYVNLGDNCMKMIQSIINKTGEDHNWDNQEFDGWESGKVPFVFFSENETDDYMFFTGGSHISDIESDKYKGRPR